ncbi:MAG: HD domain-containing protein [Campylobacterales bacterium]|nr:HD domain-containing protein [Campylobacterales bacterium]
MSIENRLIQEIEQLQENFNLTTERMLKEIRRDQRIMGRSDKRQRKEYDELQQRLTQVEALQKEIEETQKEVVFTMGAIGETRSKETGKHVNRVAEYSKLLALYYGLSEEEAETLKQASPMHDIGKVAIPDAILNKPAKLNDEERAIMNTHAELGYGMLRYSLRPLLECAAIVAYEHHEKYDGSGYPRGLKGEEIHIYGRITAVADVFDALGSKRCYKVPWEDEAIFAYFKEQRGLHFDPRLVDILFDHIDEFKAIRERLADTPSLTLPTA